MTRGLPSLLVILAIMLAPAASWPVDEPPGQPEERRRPLRELIYGATPEERERLAEERRRLSATAKSFGTDPTAIFGFYQLLYQRNAYTNNVSLDAAVADIRVPVTPNFIVRATLPYVWLDQNQPRGATENGASDTVLRLGGRIYASDNVALFIGGDASFPTAAKTQLGTGKYTLGPGGALAFPLPRLRSLFFTVVQDFSSVGGDPSRADIHYMRVQPTVNTIWSEHWWTSVVGTVDIDWNNQRKTSANLVGEIGHNFDQHWNLFAGGGVGVAGRDSPFLGLDWTVNAGVRWVFQTPLFGKTVFGGPLGK